MTATAAKDVTFETLDLEPFRELVQNCRDGDYRGLTALTKLIRVGQITHANLGSTSEEFDGFIQGQINQDRENAPRYLEEARAGNLENIPALEKIFQRQPSLQERIGLPAEEFRILARRCNLETALRVAGECRESDYQNLPVLVQILELEKFEPDETGVQPAELVGFVKRFYVEQGTQIVEACRNGDFSRLLEVLKDLGKKYSAAEIGTTKQEVDGFHATNVVQNMNLIAAECREGDYKNLVSLKVALEQTVGLELTGLKFTVEEVEQWDRMTQLLGVNLSPPKLFVARNQLVHA